MRARQRLVGLGALVVLAAILVGLPALLLALGGNPLPATVPSLDQVRNALLTPDDGTLALTGAKLLGWVVWAALSASIVVEAVSALRGVRPPEMPALSLPQSGMRPLVIAALALFVAAPGGTLPAAAAAPAPVTAAVSASAPVTAGVDTSPATVASVPATPAPTEQEPTSSYVVRPGDTLWSIAQRHLGSGHDYHRIVDLNREYLTGGADWVTPGMVLQLPTTQTGAGTDEQTGQEQEVAVQTGDTLSGLAAEHLGEGTRWPEIYEASTDTVQPDGRRLSDPDLIYPGWRLSVPAVTERQVVDRAGESGGADRGTPTGTPGHAAGAEDGQVHRARAVTVARTSIATGASLGTPAVAPVADAEAFVGTGGAGIGDSAGDGSGSAQGDAARDTMGEAEAGVRPSWVLDGIVGSGALLGGGLFLSLTRARRSGSRHRRPGRAIPHPPPVLAPVEKTLQTRAAAATPVLQHLHDTLRRLGAARVEAGLPVPAVAAVHVSAHGLVLHLSEATQLGDPWQDCGQEVGSCLRWLLPAGTPLERVGPLPVDASAPYPLLVTVGAGAEGSIWLFNLEGRLVHLTGAHEFVADLARYLAAEIALNPWSAGARLDCVGIAQEVQPMNPARIRVTTGEQALAHLVQETVGMVRRIGDADLPTARVRQEGEDTWPAQGLLAPADLVQAMAERDELVELLTEHRGRTSACLLIAGDVPIESATRIEATADGRVLIPSMNLDLTGVGLTADEAAGCAALLTHYLSAADTAMPPAAAGEAQAGGWRQWTDQAGAILPENTVPRDRPPSVPDAEDASTTGPAQEKDLTTLLSEDADTYQDIAATTALDLSVLSPRVEPEIARQVLDTGAALDANLAAWWDPQARVPRLTLLGPVRAQTWGKPLAERKAYFTELLAYLALHPDGVTAAQIADDFGITEAKTRDYIGRCREWLGTDPSTGDLHVPHAQDSPAARERGGNLYQVLGLLVDVDLFRRLRCRAEARGGAGGIADLEEALRLVGGPPFAQLRRGGWAWLYDGDRIDHHMACAVVDVAHIVTTHHLTTGNLAGARAAVEIAHRAAPYEEITTLDLAAVTATEGHNHQAMRLLRDEVCNRTDDPDLPPQDLPDRTRHVLDRHGWPEGRREAG